MAEGGEGPKPNTIDLGPNDYRVIGETPVKNQPSKEAGVIGILRKRFFPSAEERAQRQQQEAQRKAQNEARIKEELQNFIPSDAKINDIEKAMTEAAAARGAK